MAKHKEYLLCNNKHLLSLKLFGNAGIRLFICRVISGKTYTLKEAQHKMEAYCAYQERCHTEVVKKLKEMRMIPMAIDEIIHHLIQENYLNEERFSRNFARGKFRIKSWGKNRIIRELKSRNISKYNINNALKELEEFDYLGKLDELALKKNAQIKETNKQKKRKKLADYLLYRGWESALVYEKIKELIP